MISEVICGCLMLAKDLTFCAAIDVTEVLVRLVKCNVKDRENLIPPHYEKGHYKNRTIINI